MGEARANQGEMAGAGLLYSVIFATRCRSTHHRLALDALRHMKGPHAAGWRALLLHHHQSYLKGAKAPDDEFKDFKNHVLHVRDGDWGGAREAAWEWRRRLARALEQKDWAHVAWCAGVMSHYVVDPHQPFHTHQTEEENTIHRAVEWSFAKSYETFQAIIARDLGGYPDVAAPQGENWLGELITEGARLATREYETIVAHYDFEMGVKRPQEGLDPHLRKTAAALVARAAVAWARCLDRVFAESGVKPPHVDGGLHAFFLALEAPIQSVLGLIGDVRERALVAAQYDEYKRTGKVRATLSEDDAGVRALYAAEVLKAPLSSLDALWPREIGAAHAPSAKTLKRRGQAARKRRPAPAPIEPAPPPGRNVAAPVAAPAEPAAFAAPPPPPPAPPVAEAAPIAPPEAPEPSAAPKPRRRKAAAGDLDAGVALPPVDQRAPPPSPPLLLTRKAGDGGDEALDAFTLFGSSPIEDAPSIGPKTARRLEGLGVFTVSDLLALSPATAAVLLNVRHISAPDIADWQTQAMLACTIPSLKSREAQALTACGFADAQRLAQADPRTLAAAMREWAKESKRIWGDAPAPTEADAADLIARARESVAIRSMTPV